MMMNATYVRRASPTPPPLPLGLPPASLHASSDGDLAELSRIMDLPERYRCEAMDHLYRRQIQSRQDGQRFWRPDGSNGLNMSTSRIERVLPPSVQPFDYFGDIGISPQPSRTQSAPDLLYPPARAPLLQYYSPGTSSSSSSSSPRSSSLANFARPPLHRTQYSDTLPRQQSYMAYTTPSNPEQWLHQPSRRRSTHLSPSSSPYSSFETDTSHNHALRRSGRSPSALPYMAYTTPSNPEQWLGWDAAQPRRRRASQANYAGGSAAMVRFADEI